MPVRHSPFTQTNHMSPVRSWWNSRSSLLPRARIKSEMDHLNQLRDAYFYPKRNRAAYISTMEQMLALARTVDNSPQEAWILWLLGKTKIEQNLIDEACRQIKQARAMFAQEGMEEYRNLAGMDLAIAFSKA